MKAVGIKVLKAKLSQYVRLVKSGETVLVTERNEVVAELCPPRHEMPRPSTLAGELEALAEEGKVTLAAESIRAWKGVSSNLSFAEISSGQILDELRKESQ